MAALRPRPRSVGWSPVKARAQELLKDPSVSRLTSPRNSTHPAGLRECRPGKDPGRDGQESTFVQTAPRGAHSEQPLLKGPLHEVSVLDPARGRGRLSQWKLTAPASPEIGDSSTHDHQEEAVVALATAAIGADEVEQGLGDDVVRIFAAKVVPTPSQAARKSDDRVGRHTVGDRCAGREDIRSRRCRRRSPPRQQTLSDANPSAQTVSSRECAPVSARGPERPTDRRLTYSYMGI